MYHLFFLDYFMLPDMVVSGNVTCAALQQAAASGEVDHDLWGRELTYISGKMPDKLLFQGAPEAFNFRFYPCSHIRTFNRHNCHHLSYNHSTVLYVGLQYIGVKTLWTTTSGVACT